VNTALRIIVAVAVALSTSVSVYAAGTHVELPAPLGPADVTVVMEIAHSRFAPAQLRVVEGTTVRFVVRNADPINHEFIVGPPEVHARHRFGTEAVHPPVPGEVSVPALERAVTSFTFDDAGTFEFACHLAGHYDYGMRGAVEVVPKI